MDLVCIVSPSVVEDIDGETVEVLVLSAAEEAVWELPEDSTEAASDDTTDSVDSATVPVPEVVCPD